MGVELTRFHNRMKKKLLHRPTMTELYEQLCPTDGLVQNDRGQCPVCAFQITAPDPIPPGTMISTDNAMAERQREFWSRYEQERAERDRSAPPSSTKATDQPGQRDWSRVIDAHGHVR